VDQLGSGVINVNKFIHDYADGVEPTFIEGHTFKMMIPIQAVENELEVIEGTIEGTVEGVIGGVKPILIFSTTLKSYRNQFPKIIK